MAHILAVDDDPDLCTLLKTALERDGHAVEIRTSGVTVTESLCRWADCILLDVMMPGEDGFATCRRIRAITQAPILFLTARTDEQSVLTGLGIGADDYLTKPFDRAELLARIQAVVRRSKGHANSVIRTGDVEVNLDTQTVSVNGETLHLTGKEYGIMELLSLRKGSTLNKDQFLNHLYGGIDEPELKIIDVFICKLRKKLEKASGGKNYIETVWGRGYVLRDPDEKI